MYTLYYSPGAASMAAHLALLEIGAPHQLEKVELPVDRHKHPEYFRLNPRGQVPTLIVEGEPCFESSAIVQLLAERHPEARLAPAPGSALRPGYLQWLAFLATSLGASFRLMFRPGDLGYAEMPPDLQDGLRHRIEGSWELVDAHLAQRGPYLLGADLGAADLLALQYMRWSRNMPRPATDWPALAQYADTLRARPSWQRMCEVEGLTEWVR